MENSAKKTLKVTTAEQFQLLCQEIKKHPELASKKPVFGGSKSKVESIWADVTSKLNGIGPPQRDNIEWKKVWSDLKGRTKKKISENHQSLVCTGGGPYCHEALSPLEEMVDEAINIRSAAVPAGNVVGLVENFDDLPSGSKTNSGKQNSRKRTTDSTNDLLREQVKQQKMLLEILGDVKETQTKNLEQLKRQADATEKLADIAQKFFNYITSD